MAKATKLTPHIDYLDECLFLLREKIGESKQYLSDIRWQDLSETEDREREFKFQATLLDKYTSWLGEYARLSGMTDKLKELEQTDDKDVRKGSYKSAFAEMSKNGDFDE